MPSGPAPASLARGAAVTTLATAASRVTGLVRVIVVAGAMGTTFLANTYQTANTAPNILFELLAAGVLTSVFVPTFVGYLVAGRSREGWDAANALASVALAALLGLAVVLALAAPVVMRVLTLGVEDDVLRAREIALGSQLLRLFAPQVIFYGAGMIMMGALHAHRRFALPALAPIFNNVVVIAVYLIYAAVRAGRPPDIDRVTAGETLLLGAGTTAGVVAMTACLMPQLTRLGWRFRFRFDPHHPAVRKAGRLAVWALGYAGGYQAGLVVVLVLANRVEGGVAAYQWAYTFFYLPHAFFGVPLFNVLFTAMSEHAAAGDPNAFAHRLRDGLGMLAFLLVPVSLFLVVAAHPLARVTLQYGVMTTSGAALIARVLAALALGLPFYSAFLVFTRAFYARSDARTPALVNAGTVLLASVSGAALFLALPARWAVAGLALGHSFAFAVGALFLGWLSLRAGRQEPRLGAPIRRIIAGAAVSGAAMSAVRLGLADGTRYETLANLLATAIAGAIVYLGAMRLLRAPELDRLVGLVKRPEGAGTVG
ncbi:MAG: murein biosynthesis integral membrane protein MurJ [Actinomycetota bacterium]